MKIKTIHIVFFGLALVIGCSNLQENNEGHFEYENMYDFYSKQSLITSPGKYEFLYKDLPDDPELIASIVQGLLIDEAFSFLYKIKPFKERQKVYNTRKVEDILEIIYKKNSESLTFPRKPENRLPVICSNFASIYCSILRYKNIPARVRAGYATYFSPGKYENHYVCEYWKKDENRWVQVDPEIDKYLRDFLNITFNTTDMPKNKFISAGQAWKLSRNGTIDTKNIGMGSEYGWDSFGWDMLRPGVFSDFIALNKFELQPWDINPIWDDENKMDILYIDSIAQLIISDNFFEKRILLFQSDGRLRMPKKWKIK